MKKKFICGGILALCLSMTFAGCASVQEGSQEEASAEQTQKNEGSADVLGGNIGIVFQNKKDETEKKEAYELKKLLEEKGYEVEVVFSDNNSETQEKQIEDMIEAKKSCLIVNPVDADGLEDTLRKADKQGITVVAYDTMLMNTDLFSCYVGYDYKAIGESVGSFIVEDKKLDAAKKSSACTIEFFMGDLLNENERLQLEGILNVLQPYFDKGVLQCKSLRTDYEDVSIAKASQEIAEQTCDSIMKANYMDDPVDIVCVGNEELAEPVIKALKDQSGFEDNWPLLISLDAAEETYERIENKTQALTVQEFRDNLPNLCADLVDKEIQEEKIKDLKKINNGKTDVPAILGKTKLAYEDNYKQIMAEAGMK